MNPQRKAFNRSKGKNDGAAGPLRDLGCTAPAKIPPYLFKKEIRLKKDMSLDSQSALFKI